MIRSWVQFDGHCMAFVAWGAIVIGLTVLIIDVDEIKTALVLITGGAALAVVHRYVSVRRSPLTPSDPDEPA